MKTKNFKRRLAFAEANPIDKASTKNCWSEQSARNEEHQQIFLEK